MDLCPYMLPSAMSSSWVTWSAGQKKGFGACRCSACHTSTGMGCRVTSFTASSQSRRVRCLKGT